MTQTIIAAPKKRRYSDMRRDYIDALRRGCSVDVRAAYTEIQVHLHGPDTHTIRFKFEDFEP